MWMLGLHPRLPYRGNWAQGPEFSGFPRVTCTAEDTEEAIFSPTLSYAGPEALRKGQKKSNI